MRQFACPKAVTHSNTNRARCRATALIETNALPLHQTAKRGLVLVVYNIGSPMLKNRVKCHVLSNFYGIRSEPRRDRRVKLTHMVAPDNTGGFFLATSCICRTKSATAVVRDGKRPLLLGSVPFVATERKL